MLFRSLTRLKEVRIYPRSDEGHKKAKMEMSSVKHPKVSITTKENEDKAAKRSAKKESGEKKKGRTSVETSSKKVKSKNDQSRLKEVRELAKTGDAKAIGSLTLALKDKNPEVRKEAERALEKIGETLREERSSDDADADEPTSWGEGEKNLTLKTGSGNGVNLELSNDVPVRAVQFTLEGAKPSDIHTTSRTEGFYAKVNEENGTVVMVSLSGNKIAPGTGPIAEIICNKGSSARLSKIKIE